MARWQGKSKKKPTGGRRWPKRKKRRYELGRESAEARVGEQKRVKISIRGSKDKVRLLSAKEANVTNPETGESAKAQINSVIENPADPHLVRRNIITKGAVIDTEVGKARVTSRPGQSGIVNAILLEGSLEKKPPEKPPQEKPVPEEEEETSEEEAGEGEGGEGGVEEKVSVSPTENLTSHA